MSSSFFLTVNANLVVFVFPFRCGVALAYFREYLGIYSFLGGPSATLYVYPR